MADAPGSLRLQGLGVSPGRGAGPVVRVAGAVPEPPPDLEASGDPDSEVGRALEALKAVAADLEARGEHAGGEAQDVLDAQAMMARDPGLADDVRRRTSSGAAAARAVYDAFGAYREALAGAGDYLAARVADLDDVRDRAVAALTGQAMPGVPTLREPSVIAGRDLAPADTALLDPDLVIGLVTEQGGPTSHTAILARALGVPAVVACPGAAQLPEGITVLLDGLTGEVVSEPSTEQVAEARADAQRRRHLRAQASAVTGPGRLADGTPVPLLANIGSAADAESAAAAGAEGVGLLRTELAFLDRAQPPSEDEQVALYVELLRPFAGRRVVARLLDAGADKPLPFLSPPDEPNPAMGLRGLRALLAQPSLLATQVRALAAAGKRTGVFLELMAPMVSVPAEAAAFRSACREAGFAGPVGVMVEIPAAAVRAADLLAEVDFVSLGTNDLAQYLFAADRQVGALAAMQDPWQPALLDLVAATAAAATAAGKGCGVCGEAAADPALAAVLVGLGVSSLSAGAASLALVRAALAAHDRADCVAAAEAARAARDAVGARAAAMRMLPGLG